MSDASEKTRRTKAIVATVVFHSVVLLLFLLFGLRQPVPLPDDAGASIEFGWDEAASGDAVADIDNVQATQNQQQQEIPQEEIVDQPPVEETVTESESEVSIPEPKKENKPKPKEPKPEKPIEKPKPAISSDLSNALESLSKPAGGSQGNKEGVGDEGDPKGSTGAGALGGGSGSWQLDGRSMLAGYGTKITDTKEEGIVVMNIWVDRNGKVTKVQPNLRESNTTSQYLINLAKNDVLNNFKYNGDPSASIEQRGKVRYNFQLK